MAIQKCLIQEAKNVYKESIGYPSYKSVNFNSFRSNSYGSDNGFINYKGLTFIDYVGCQYLTGNELLYYPELAKKMREVKEYPVLKRSYSVDNEVKGMAFFDYFYHKVNECHQLFKKDLAEASKEVNNLIHLYGEERYTPIVNAILTEGEQGYYQRKKLLINGIQWELERNRTHLKITECLDFSKLLDISNDFRHVNLEAAEIGTPFIALRIGKTWKHKGNVHWYSLDTLKKVSKSDILKWKP